MTKPTKRLCAQRRLRSAWASAQSDQNLCWPWVLSYPLSAQRRLWSDWADLLVLSCRGSNTLSIEVLFGLGNCCIQWDSNASWIPDSKSGGLTSRSSRDNKFAEPCSVQQFWLGHPRRKDYGTSCTLERISLHMLSTQRWQMSRWQNQQNDCAPSEDSDQPGHPPSLIRVFACAKRVAKDPSFLHADSEDSDQTGRMPRLI